MRVLLTTDTVGGVWTFTRELTTGLLDAGHTVSLVSLGRTPSPEQQHWADQLASARFHFTTSCAPLEWMSSNAAAYTDAEPLLLALIRTFAPDLLHLNQFCFGALPTTVPRLVTAHSDVLSWAAACRPEPLERSPWLSRYTTLVQRGLDHATALTAPTAASLADLRHHWPLAPAQHVLHNGRSLPEPTTTPTRQLQAVTAGRLWDEAKNIASLARITTSIPIHIAGERDLSPAHTTPLPPQLHVTGTLAEADLLHLFRSSAIYLAPALYEPFGLAPLEAALCGCALILRDLPSLRELWHGSALFYTTDADLEQHLNQLATNPAELARWQHRATTRAAHFSRSRMTDAYLDLYRQLIPAEAAQHVA